MLLVEEIAVLQKTVESSRRDGAGGGHYFRLASHSSVFFSNGHLQKRRLRLRQLPRTQTCGYRFGREMQLHKHKLTCAS